MIISFKIKRTRFCLITLLFYTAILSGCCKKSHIARESNTRKQAAEKRLKIPQDIMNFIRDSSGGWRHDSHGSSSVLLDDTTLLKRLEHGYHHKKIR